MTKSKCHDAWAHPRLTKSERGLYSNTVDRDEFTKATRLGRIAARSLLRATEGDDWSEAPCRRFLEVVLSRQIPSLSPVFACAKEIAEADLFPLGAFEAMDALDKAAREARGSALDVLVREVAMRSVADECVSSSEIAARFVDRVFARFVIDGRGGLREIKGDDFVRSRGEHIRRLVEPLLGEAASSLVDRPDAVRRKLTRGYLVSADTDLLAGSAP